MTASQELGGTFLGGAKFSEDVMRRGNVTHAEALSFLEAGHPRLRYGQRVLSPGSPAVLGELTLIIRNGTRGGEILLRVRDPGTGPRTGTAGRPAWRHALASAAGPRPDASQMSPASEGIPSSLLATSDVGL
ncbi:MAG: hypothetical protein ACE5JQ_02760 [Candidatus Methylomirabilales bacterium]